MARRLNGEGSVSQRRDGRWQAQVSLNGRRRTVYAKTEREARAKLRELQRETDTTGTIPSPGKRTVSDLIDAWLASAPVKPSTAVQYRKFFDTYARPALGNTRLANVNPAQIQHLYAQLTPSTAAHVHAILHRAFKVAVLWAWLPVNPCDRVLKPAHKTARKQLWTRAELDTFLAGTADHWLRPLWLLLTATGMRIGEALALRWEHVGLGGVAVTVAGTLQRIEGEWTISTPKTAAGARTIVLPPVAIAALTARRDQQAAWREAAGARWQDSDLVFTGENGQPLHPSTVDHALKRECDRLGLPAVTPHGLRHLHASLLIGEGVPITAVSARLGHASPQITMQVYAHALPGQDVAAAQAIARALGSGVGDVTPPALGESGAKVGHEVERG